MADDEEAQARALLQQIDSKQKRKKPLQTDSEKNRRRRHSSAENSKRRVLVGGQWERWIQLSTQLNLTSESLAETLLNLMYDAKSKEDLKNVPSTSTPVSSKGVWEHPLHVLEVSEISSSESLKSAESGIEPFEGHASTQPAEPLEFEEHGFTQPALLPDKRNTRAAKVLEASFVNPLEISFDVSEEDVPDDDKTDPDYIPSCAAGASVCPHEWKDLQEMAFEDLVLGQAEEEGDQAEPELNPTPGVHRNTVEDAPALAEARTCLVYLDQLLVLGRKAGVSSECKVKGCTKEVLLTHKTRGSAVHLDWVCANQHLAFRWRSQPMLNFQMNAGDLLIASAILLSGNNFSKMKLLASFMNLAFVTSAAFFRIQANYLLPAIEESWDAHVQELRASLCGKDLIVLGDGRMDSPGFSAQFCTYSLMEETTKKVVSLSTVDKRETDRKSPVMEKEGFNRALGDLQQTCKVVEVVTDAHVQITAKMRKEHPEIHHSYDVWHGAKNLGNKVVEASRDKNCKDLIPWVSSVVNHFWYTCRHAETLMRFRDIWCGLLHHIVNEHQWLLSYNEGTGQCSHADMEREERPWLKKSSPAFRALRNIVMSKHLLKTIPYYLKFRTTSELECFNQLILMYASKRFSYTPPVYRARCKLAALDHNNSVDRLPKTDKDGNKQYRRVFNKKTLRWSAVLVKLPKTYAHIRELKTKIFSKRLSSTGMRTLPLSPGDPRRISAHLAPTSPPPTQEIVAQRLSRFKKTDEGVPSLSSSQ